MADVKKHRRILLVLMLIMAVMLMLSSCFWRVRINEAPSGVVNIYPAQSELVDENTFHSKWTQSTDPEGGEVTYRINYAQTIEGLNDPTYYETVETYFLLPNLAEGIWYWQVTAMDTAGNSTKSPVWTFTVNGEMLPQPVDTEEIPADPSLIVSSVENTSFSLKWPAYEDRQNPTTAVEYVIYVYNAGNGTVARETEQMGQWMARTTPATTAYTTDTSHTFSNMNTNTLYDWVIVAQNNASQTSVVGSSQLRTGNRSPSQPELLNPTEGATEVATDVTLSWTASVDPDGNTVNYYVYIDIVKNTNRNVTVEGIEETAYQPQGMEAGRTYYWFIMAKDGNGGATKTQTNTFMTYNEGMSVAASPTPADGTEGVDATHPPLLQWEHDKNGAAIEYSVYLSSNPKKIDKIAGGLVNKEYQLPGFLEGDTRYYWQVEARDTGTEKTTRSGVWIFRTGTITPPVQTGAVTNTDGTQIVLTYDKTMGDPAGKKDSYRVKKEVQPTLSSREMRPGITYQTITTSKIELKAGTTNAYVLTLEEAIINGEKIYIDYTPGTIRSTDGGKLSAYTDATVTNLVPGTAPAVEEATASTNTIEIAFDKDMKAVPANAKTQFSVQSGSVLKQIETVTQTASDTYTLTLKVGQNIAYGDTVLLSYTRGTVQAENEAYLESFAGIAVLNAVPAPVPQFVSGETTTDGETVKVAFDREMADPTGKQGQFTLNVSGGTAIRTRPGITIDSATLNTADAKIIELGLSVAVANGEVLTLNYTAGDVESADGAALASFTNASVTNTVPAPLPICTAATMTSEGRTVNIAFDRDMRAPTAEETNQFGVLVNGYVNEIENATLSADRHVIELGLAKPVGKNNEVHISYTRGTVSSVNGGLLESFQNRKVNTDALMFIWVNKGVGWNYSSINDAIDAAEDGEIILVATGTYNENVNFDGKALLLASTYLFDGDEPTRQQTIIDGGNNGTPAVTIGVENSPAVTERLFNPDMKLPDLREYRTRALFYSLIGGFTIRNGAGSIDSSERIGSMGAGVYTVGNAAIAANIITDNGTETGNINGHGVYIFEGRVEIYMNTITNNFNSWRGAGIYVSDAAVSEERVAYPVYIAANEITNNKAPSGAGIYIEEGKIISGVSENPWKTFNSPHADVLFVEDTSTDTVDTFSGNSLVMGTGVRTDILEGTDIQWAVVRTTPDGTLSLRPETGTEQATVTLSLDYVIGTEYYNGTVIFTLTDTAGDGFEITDEASVIIGTDATAITNYTYSTKVATVTGIKLKSGTVTLSLAPQVTPSGTVLSISARTLNYGMGARGDADGPDSVWTVSGESARNFVSSELSVVTDIDYVSGNEPYIKLLTAPKSLKVASETTVDTLLASIRPTDDSSQTYEVITAGGTKTGTDQLTQAATLIVMAEHGNTQDYAVAINPTAFVRLETNPSVSDERLISRTGFYWQDTIGEAVTAASNIEQSTITVWPGVYLENVNLGAKIIHLMSTDPASQTLRETTIIDAGYAGNGITIQAAPGSSVRTVPGETIVEGFTVRHAVSSVSSAERGGIIASAGIYVNGMNCIIRNNLITENGTVTLSGSRIIGSNCSGIYMLNTVSEIYDNTVSYNCDITGTGGGIILGSLDLSTARNGYPTHVKVYGNEIANNVASEGAGIYVHLNAGVFNRDDSEWRRFNAPAATISFVEHNSSEADNNTYSSNSLYSVTAAGREVANEGADIRFMGDLCQIAGQLNIAPATISVDDVENLSMTATYTIIGDAWEASVTFDLPAEMTITTDASLTAGGFRRAVAAEEIYNAGHRVIVDGVNSTGTACVVLDFNHHTAVGAGDYPFNGSVDADGDGTHYRASDTSSATLTVLEH